MSVTYSWKINSLATNPEPVDGSEDVIVQINASRVATDGINTIQDARVISWSPSELSGPFAPLSDVTEADVIGWIESAESTQGVVLQDDVSTTSLDRADADLARQLEAAVAAPVAAPLPWAEAV